MVAKLGHSRDVNSQISVIGISFRVYAIIGEKKGPVVGGRAQLPTLFSFPHVPIARTSHHSLELYHLEDLSQNDLLRQRWC